MCYKEEKQRQVAEHLNKKLEGVPSFIKDFFKLYESRLTANNVWSYVKNMLEWMISKKIIQKEHVQELSEKDLNNITAINMLDYFDDMLYGTTVNKCSKNTILTKKDYFKSFWTYLVEQHYVDTNIFDTKSIFKKYEKHEKKEVFVPSKKSVKSFLKNLKMRKDGFVSVRDYTVVQLLLGSGIRSEEILGLDLGDVYLDNDIPFIHIWGKGNKQRDVFITEEAANHLREYIKERDEFLDGDNVQALFISNRKGRLSKTVVTTFFKKCSGGEITPHSLRHYVGSEMTNDFGISVAAEQLGHSSVSITSKHYVRIYDETLSKALESLNKTQKKYSN